VLKGVGFLDPVNQFSTSPLTRFSDFVLVWIGREKEKERLRIIKIIKNDK